MAETSLKRQRDETQVAIEGEEESKRHKSYNHILSLLESEDDEPTPDVSSLITTLQQELSSQPTTTDPLKGSHSGTESDFPATSTFSSTLESTSLSPVIVTVGEDGEDKDSVIRHLLEASDDELGIPHREIRVDEEYDEYFTLGEGPGISFYDDGLWEFENEAADYFTLLQPELFM